MKLFTFFFYLLTTLSFANDESQRIANELNSYGSNTSLSSKISPVDSDVAKIKEKIEKVQEKLLNLEVAVELGIEEFNFKEEVIAIDRELWKQLMSFQIQKGYKIGDKQIDIPKKAFDVEITGKTLSDLQLKELKKILLAAEDEGFYFRK